MSAKHAPSGFLHRSYEHLCKDCGADISYRSINTELCFDCATKRAKERERKKKDLLTLLTARNAIKPAIDGICQACSTGVSEPDIFCRHCGQRLKEE